MHMIGVKNGECQIHCRIQIEAPIKSVMTLQMGSYLMVWPDKSKNNFNIYDLKSNPLITSLDALSPRQPVPVILGVTFPDVSDQDMATLISLESHRYSNDEKFYISLLFPDRVEIKKSLFFRALAETEEKEGWKPPLFLIGIGLALLYQFFFRPKGESKGGFPNLSKKGKHGMTSKDLSSLNKLGKRTKR